MNALRWSKRHLLAIILLLGLSSSFAQTTYYSRNGATAPRNWDEADSWTLNADGSGPAAAIPTRSDHVVILNGHTIIIDNVADNGSAGVSPSGLGNPLVGSFAGSGTVCFYQTGDITVEGGGSLTTSVRLMLAGNTFVVGGLNVGGDLVNIGNLFLTSSATFSSLDDLILSGASTARIDNGSSFSNDDLYIDHTSATLCGTGSMAVGVSSGDPALQFLNGATINQICSGFTVTGCATCPKTGTGPLPSGPSLTGTGGTINYIENAVEVIDPAITVTYSSGPYLVETTIAITANYVQGEDILAFPGAPGISASFNVVSGILTLSGYGNAAAWQAALRTVTFENLSDNPTLGTRTVTFQITDGFTPSNIVSRDIDINRVNDPPDVSTVSGSPTPLMYFEGDGDVAIDDQITVADPDDTDFESAVITISNFMASEDVITFVNQNGITGVLVGGTLTLTGTSTLANYQTALRSITYENTSQNPNTTTRTASFVVNDGDANSLAFDRDIEVNRVNDSPVITSTAPTTATEDVLYSYTATVSDPDDTNNGTDLTWTLSGAPAGMTVSTTGVVSWTPLEGVLTSGAVTLTVTDGGEDGAIAGTEVFTITVTPVNDGPTITSTAPTIATEEVLYTYTATVADPDDNNDGTELLWSLTNAPAGMVVSSTGVVTWTPAEGTTTSGAVTLTVQDGGEDGALPDTEVFTITVTVVNDGPTITSTAPTTATEDVLYSYSATVTDPDDANNGTDLTWSLSGEPAGMVVSSTGVVTWTPLEGVLTSGTVTLTVQDGGENGALPDSEVFTITVTPVNDGPTITSTAPTTATEEVLYTYTATVSDPDDANNGTDLIWTLSGEPAGMVVSTTGVVTWTPAEGVTTSGAVTLTVQDGGEDGALPDSEVFTITVTVVNDGPTITSTASTTATEDVLYTYSATVTDPDDSNNGTDLTWSLSGEPAGMVVSSTGVVTWTPLEGVLTSGAVTLTVQDGGENGALPDSEVFTVTVTPVNDGPTITSTAPTTATEDVLYSYSATVTDPDDANNGTDLIWSLSGEPAGMVVSATGVVTWTPAEGITTSGTVTLTVQDGGEDGASPDSELFTITVTPVNDGPTITSTAPTSATEDILYTYAAIVTDPDDANNGTDLSWSLSGEPAGMVVSSTGVVSWTPLEGVLTSGAVTLTVQDAGEDGALPDSEVFTITVTPVNDGPTITSTAPTTATEAVLYTYSAIVSDPDDANNGTDLTWSLSGEPAGMLVSSTGVVTWTPAGGVTTSGAVTLTVQDGGEDGALPDSEVFTITVTPANDGPTITSTAPTTATEDILYTYTATVNDPDDANNGTDLSWSLSGEPAGMVVSSTGVVTWTPLEGILTSGSVTLTVQDGGEDGALPDSEVFTITVTPVNDSPTITSTAPNTATEDVLYTYTPVVDDPDDPNNGTDLTWSLSGEPAGMTVSATGEVSWTPLEGVLTSGTVTLTVQDGGEDGSISDSEDFTITVTPVNDSPDILIGGVPKDTIMISTDEEVAISVLLDATDPEGDAIAVDSGVSVDGFGTISLDANPLIFVYTPALDFVGIETLKVFVCDNGSPVQCDTLTVLATVNPINDAPTLSSTVSQLDYTEGDGPVPINDQIIVDDIDNTDLVGAVVAIETNYFPGEDFLAFTDQNGISGSLSGNTLTLTGVSSLANYQTALRSVTYENPSGAPELAVRTVDFIVDDGSLSSMPYGTDIVITPIIISPVLTGSGGVLNYTEGDGAVVLDNGISLSDGDDTNIDDATIVIDGNYAAGEDVLGFIDQAGITGNFDAGSGTLSLTGSSAVSNYQSALRSITYENTSNNPSPLLRTVSFVVNDGDGPSNVITRDINVIPVNSGPIAQDDLFSGFEDTPLLGNVLTNDSDPDGDVLTINTTPVTAPQNGSVTISTDGSIEFIPDADFFGTDTFSYEVCDPSALCSTAMVTLVLEEVIDIKVFQAVSPNSDGLNDTWRIQDIHKFANNVVRLFDRWDNIVYEETGYNNSDKVWMGESNAGSKPGELPAATYFYVINLGDGSPLLKGFIVLRR